MKSLKAQIISATKTLNSRLRRLRAEDLPTATDQKLQDIELFRPGFVTGKRYVSSATAGMSDAQLKEKLDIIKDLISTTETVKEAREYLEKKMKKWKMKKEEAKERIRRGRVFYRVLGYQNGIFDSDQVHESIEEFDKTPDYPELIDRLMRDYGQELQNERNGREVLLEWMNEKQEIPLNVDAIKDPTTGQIVYGYIDQYGDIVYT